MIEQVGQLCQEALRQIQEAAEPVALEGLRVQYLGRKGKLAEFTAQMGQIPQSDRPAAGEIINRVKQTLTAAFQEKQTSLNSQSLSRRFSFDITLPGVPRPIGHLHPLTQVIEQVCEVFEGIGFVVVEGPEIETERYNFEALNIPADHPSRDSFDTFYLEGGKYLLRSQTSTVQIRIMEKAKPPLAIVAPGKVFRPDAVDASHSFMFHQIEGLLVDQGVTFAHLKGALDLFAKRLFGKETKIRFRPHYFPFTEPSAEVDVSCLLCQGKGCSVCGRKGWLEIMGAGMVHPNVFRAVGYDPKKYTGFAFGMGIERIAMLKHGIDDIRLFFENDVRFLEQF
ncbi:MAG: phenylalanine--tRNA ligase subunit alpha [Candidatus Omnitrophica bacterium]|nr:phenylalanine--tRNA ligase subunit alpha [Candidatus Omnitrophota bacterium]